MHKILEKDARINIEELSFCTCIMLKQKMFFFTELTDLFMEFNLQTRNIRILSNNHEKIEDGCGADSVLYSNGKIYKLQKNGRKILEYSFEAKKQFVYEINEKTQRWGNFSYMAIYDHYLYLFPRYVNKTIIIDLKIKKIISSRDFFDENKDINLKSDVLQLRKGCKVCDKFVMLFSKDSNDVFFYDLELKKYQIKTVNTEVEGIVAASQFGNDICIIDSKNKLYKWNFKCNNVQLLCEISMVGNENTLGKIICTNKNIILLPLLGENIYIYDNLDEKISLYQDYPEDFYYSGDKNWAKYINECRDDDVFYFPMRRSNYILRIEETTGNIKWIKPIPPLKEERIQYYGKKDILDYKEGKRLLNDNTIDLKGFISVITWDE